MRLLRIVSVHSSTMILFSIGAMVEPSSEEGARRFLHCSLECPSLPQGSQYLTEGGESKVFLSEDGRSAIKVNDTGYYATWTEYFSSLLLHNLLLGFIEIDDKLSAVVQQPFVKGDQASLSHFLVTIFRIFLSMILPDVLHPGLDVVFCGTAAGDRSAERRAYYAGPGNQFYTTLHLCGWTARLLLPQEFMELASYRIGLTDLAKSVHGGDNALRHDDFDVMGLQKKILLYQPAWLCFNGKKAAAVFLQSKRTVGIQYGLQQQRIGDTKIFVAPSTSGAARGAWDITRWHELKKLIDAAKGPNGK